MDMVEVESTNIKAIGYKEDDGVLHILFLSGRLYEYYDVPQYVFDDFCNAESKGGYAHANIYRAFQQQRLA